MRFSVAVAALASVFSVAQARINGISVPATIKPGDGFNVVIESSDYIQSVYDVAIVFGAASGEGYPGNLGTVLASYYLGPGMLSSKTLAQWGAHTTDTLTGCAQSNPTS